MKLDMRALVATAPNKFEIQQVPVPKISDDEVLCRIKAVAICGTDPDLFEGKLQDIGWPPKYPFIFGHEWAGEVVSVGKNVHNFKKGDRVAGEAHCGCGSCKNCREGKYNLCLNYGNYEAGHRHYGFIVQGAYAEYGAYDPKALTIMPDNLSFDEATMCDTGGVALHAVDIGEVRSSQTVVIIGPGPIGNLLMQICKAKGAKTIMVGRRDRLKFAKDCGADETINYETSNPPEEVMKLTNGIGADVVLECAGTLEAISETIHCVKKDGHVVIVSMPKIKEIPFTVIDMVQKQIHLTGSKANPNTSSELMQLISTKMIDAKKLITHQFDLQDMEKALDIFSNRKDGVMKVIMHP